MKSIYESLLDDQDDIMGKADDAAEKKLGEEWLNKHGIRYVYRQDTKKIKFGQFEGDFTGIVDSSGEYTLTRSDNDHNLPKQIPAILHCRKFYVKGFTGREIQDRLVPREAEVVMISNCPNLIRLPQLPDTVDTFSVVGCPQLTSLEGCPREVNRTFKVVDNGRKFEWKDIHRACPSLNKQKAIY